MSNTDTTTVADGQPTRTTDGTIVDQSSTTTTTTPTQQTTPPSTDGKTILNQKGTPEPKPEGEPTKDTKAEGAPEKYSDYKVPDGFVLDPEVKTKADGLFKELNLSQDQAQKAVDLFRELTTEAAQAPYKAYQTMTDNWLEEAKAHPDLRGKIGEGLDVNVRIGKLLDGVPDQKLASDFRQAMDITGVGNHPAFIRLMYHFAQQLTEGSHVAGNGPSPGGQSRPGTDTRPGAAAAMWPSLPSSGGNR